MRNLKEFYTSEEMVKDLLKLIPFSLNDSILDAGSGRNKVWYKCLDNIVKYECEIEDGDDFFDWNVTVDWVIGNPPFRDNAEDGKRINLVPKWIEKASLVAKVGMAFLLNHKSISSLTPVRLQKLKDKGFEITRWHIVADRRWFGRYYFVVFEKKKGIVSWERKTY